MQQTFAERLKPDAHLIVKRRALLSGAACAAASAFTRVARAQVGPSPRGWRPLINGSKVTIDTVVYEAECGLDPIAIQLGASNVVRFTVVPGNVWPRDNPNWSERAELDAWPSAIAINRQPSTVWCAWSMLYETGAWPTSDWTILQQMFIRGGQPVVHVLKGDGTLRWVAADAYSKGGSYPIRQESKIEQGTWLHFVEAYEFDAAARSGSWRSWLNGKQVLEHHGALSNLNATHCFAKFGIYRGVQRASQSGSPQEGNRVRDATSVRFCNMRFGTASLEHLIDKPLPAPAYQPI